MCDIALEILNILDKKGYEAYIIGGYPRNMLLGIKSNDIDITTSATPEILKQLFVVLEDNSKFGSLKINYKDYTYEITTFRTETYDNSRYPKINYTDDLKDDLKRRDFTINTICIDKDENIIDLMGGLEDINTKTIRCIDNIEIKLKEDPLRILRAIRFMGLLNFELEKELEENIKKYSYLLKDLSKNSILKEIYKMNEKALNKLEELDIRRYL